MNHGSVAVAIVSSQVMLVQASRSHNQDDRSLDVHVYTPFGDGVFIASDVPARIPSSDVLSNITDDCRTPAIGMLQVSAKALNQFMQLSDRAQKRHEKLWTAWKR